MAIEFLEAESMPGENRRRVQKKATHSEKKRFAELPCETFVCACNWAIQSQALSLQIMTIPHIHWKNMGEGCLILRRSKSHVQQ